MFATAVSLCLVLVVGCGDSQPAVVVYVSADEQVARPVLEAFTARTGIPVKPLFDTEATKTTGLANRLRRESDRPIADVFWSSEPFAVEQLASEGILAAPEGDALADHPAAWRHPDHRWYGFGGRARVIVYHPERLEAAKVEIGSDLWALREGMPSVSRLDFSGASGKTYLEP